MKSQSTDPSFRISQDPTHRRRRAVAGAVAGALMIGGAAEAVDVTRNIVRSVKSNVHQATESDHFSGYHLSEHMDANHIDPSTVTKRVIQVTDTTPTEVAISMHAKSVPLVAGEISSQVGGDHSMEPGESVIIPNDQLNQPAATSGAELAAHK